MFLSRLVLFQNTLTSKYKEVNINEIKINAINSVGNGCMITSSNKSFIVSIYS